MLINNHGGSTNGFTVTFAPSSPLASCGPTSITHPKPKDDLLVYPNPASTSFTIKIPASVWWDHFELVDHFGRVIILELSNSPQVIGELKFELDPSILPGVYLLRLIDKDNIALLKKIVIAR
jgi:hypothetical protein